MSSRRVPRRRFLGLGAAGLFTAGATACGAQRAQEAELVERAYVPGVAADGPLPTPGPDRDRIAAKAGQMILAGFRGLAVEPGDPIARDIVERDLGSVILFSYDVASDSPTRNVESPEQVAALTASLQDLAPAPLLDAVDQEGGAVARLGPDHGFPPTISAEELGEIDDVDVTYEAAQELATPLRDAGCNLNLAPVVDLNTNPESPAIGAIGRSFSADPDVVVRHARAFIEAHRDVGIGTALKHFPGHGSATGDSHLGFVDVTGTWSPVELDPYRALVEAGAADAVMTAHVFNADLDPDYPATLSRATIDGILRQEIGFDGVVLSDDMQMAAIADHYGFDEAVRLAIEAGVDSLTFGNNLVFDPAVVARAVDLIVALVEDGTLSEARLDASIARIDALKARYASEPTEA